MITALMAAVATLAFGPPFFGGRGRIVEHPVMVTASASRANEPVYYVTTTQPDIALTFDISWGTVTVWKVLKVLRDEHVRATFFLSGPWARDHPEIVKAIAADGHEIASHGTEHVNLSQYGEDAIRKNIMTTDQILRSIVGYVAPYFRPPNGDENDRVVATAHAVGYETVIWSVDSLDWMNPGVGRMIERVTRLSFPGAIILFHASDTSKQTDTALPAVIAGLRARGFQLVTLGRLLQLGPVNREDPRGRPYLPNQGPRSGR